MKGENRAFSYSVFLDKFDKEVEMILYDVQERNLQEGEEREVNKEEEERKDAKKERRGKM